MKIDQPHQTNDIITGVKLIHYDSVLIPSLVPSRIACADIMVCSSSIRSSHSAWPEWDPSRCQDFKIYLEVPLASPPPIFEEPLTHRHFSTGDLQLGVHGILSMLHEDSSYSIILLVRSLFMRCILIPCRSLTRWLLSISYFFWADPLTFCHLDLNHLCSLRSTFSSCASRGRSLHNFITSLESSYALKALSLFKVFILPHNFSSSLPLLAWRSHSRYLEAV